MKRHNIVFIIIFIIIGSLFLLGNNLFADITDGVDIRHNMQRRNMIDSSVSQIKTISLIIVNTSLVVGLIPVIRKMTTNGEEGKKYIISWVIAVIVAQIAFALV